MGDTGAMALGGAIARDGDLPQGRAAAPARRRHLRDRGALGDAPGDLVQVVGETRVPDGAAAPPLRDEGVVRDEDHGALLDRHRDPLRRRASRSSTSTTRRSGRARLAPSGRCGSGCCAASCTASTATRSSRRSTPAAQSLLERYNATRHVEQPLARRLLRELLGDAGEGVVVGRRSAATTARTSRSAPARSSTRLRLPRRGARSSIGETCQIAPQVAAADRDASRRSRSRGVRAGSRASRSRSATTSGSAAATIVCPGVTIGEDTVRRRRRGRHARPARRRRRRGRPGARAARDRRARPRRGAELRDDRPLPAASTEDGGGARDDARALLRPRLRLRDHAGLAHPARRPDAGRARGRRCSCCSSSGGRGTTRPGSRTSSTRTRSSCACCCSALMFASLLMAVAIPEAFGDRALLFAGVVRRDPGRPPLFLTFAPPRRGRSSASARRGSSIWLVAAGVFWLAGGARRRRRRARAVAGRARDRLRRRRSSLYWVPGPPRTLGQRPGTSRRRISRSASSSS